MLERTAQGVDQKFSRRVDCGIPTVDIEFRSGFPLWTQHHCVFTPKTTVLDTELLLAMGTYGLSYVDYGDLCMTTVLLVSMDFGTGLTQGPV
eukprot:COSAG05_NODE_11194_length_525_cov_1.920188_1_plen_92_part_00